MKSTKSGVGVMKEEVGLDYQIAKPSEGTEVLKQRQLLKEIAEKHAQWCQKLDRHLLSHVSGCQLCPIHCYPPLNKKTTRESGRRIGKLSSLTKKE